MKTTRLVATVAVITAWLLSFTSLPASAGAYTTEVPVFRQLNTNPKLENIALSVLEALSAGVVLEQDGPIRAATTDYFVWLAEQADLSPAARLATKTEKGQWVYAALRNTAERSQSSLLAFLERQGASYQSFYIVNAVLIHGGDLPLALSLAARPEVARITGNPLVRVPQPLLKPVGPASSTAIEPNITFINADDAWALGVTGEGAVLGAIDTGLQWDHPALIDHYRGWDGDLADHNYNWWDATGQYPTEPVDGNGHGTMVTGVMVGGEGDANQIGVAPGAKTIHCKAFTDMEGGTTADIFECFQWILAPWDLSGSNADPSLAPDAINNSWGGSDIPGIEAVLDALQMAGIFVEASTGGQGPGCGTVTSPAKYAQLLSTGGVDQAGGVLPGTLVYFSGRGPSVEDPDVFFPDLVAPSIDIRSTFPENDYDVWSGTAVAGAHATGLVGLVLSANPALSGNIIDITEIITSSAVPLTGQFGSSCGGNYVTGPNNDWGYGTLDALAAVQNALFHGNPGTLSGTVTDAGSEAPIAEVEILAASAVDWITTTNSLGMYNMLVPSGTYTVSATIAGYYPEVITGVAVLNDQDTILDFALESKSGVLSGQVTDDQNLQPLAAEVQVSGGLITTTLTDPATGYYSLTVATNRAYTLTALSPGYGTVTSVTDVLTNSTRVDFSLPAGWLEVMPLTLDLLLKSGDSLTVPVTLTNTGGLSLTYELSSTVGWLVVLPSVGTLPVSGTLVLVAHINTAGLPAAGVYTTTIILVTDTPYGSVSLPVTLTVLARYEVFLPLVKYPTYGDQSP